MEKFSPRSANKDENFVIRHQDEIMEKTLPAFDLIDLAAEHDYFPKKRQFAPEYS